MNVLTYIRSLLPRIAKSDVIGDLRDLRRELAEDTVPPYEAAAEIFRRWDMKSRPLSDFDKLFQRNVKSKTRGNYVVVIHAHLKTTLKSLDAIEKLLNDKFAGDVVRSNLTYSGAQLLQYIETTMFAAKYARKLLIQTYDLEMADLMTRSPAGRLTPAEEKWMAERRNDFFAAMTVLGMETRDLDKAIRSIPDVEIDEETVDAVVASVGMSKLDPLKMNLFVGTTFNVFYHIGMARASAQIKRHDASLEERKMLEYQLLDFKNAQKGEEDPKLQQAIEYTQDRLNKLNFKIRKFEEELAG